MPVCSCVCVCARAPRPDPAWAEEASFDTSWPEAAPAKEPPNSGFDAAWPEPSDIAEQPSFGQPQAPSPAQESGFGASWPDFAESAPRMPAPESNFEASWPDFGAGHQQAPDLSDSSFHSERATTKSLSKCPQLISDSPRVLFLNNAQYKLKQCT